ELALGTFQPWNPTHRLAGTIHPNFQGLNCALLVMSAVYLASQTPRYRAGLWALAAMGLLGLWLTKSRTPLIALIASEALFWFIAASWRQRLAATWCGLFVTCTALLIAGDAILDRVAQTALLGRNDADEVGALTGRVPLWEELSDSIAQRPWLGYG